MSTIFRDVVAVGTFEFNGTSPIEGVRFSCDVLDGWDDTSDPIVAVGAYGLSDGVVPADRFPLREKYIEIGGWVECYTRAQEEQAKSLIRSCFNPNIEYQLVRYGPTTQFYMVRVTQKVEILDQMGGQGFRWACQLMADWPYRRGFTEKTGEAGVFTGSDLYRTYTLSSSKYVRTYTLSDGKYIRTYTMLDGLEGGSIADRIVVNNEGDADAYAIFEVDGYLPEYAWYITNDATGEDLYFASTLNSGSTLVINTREQTAEIGEVPVDYYLRGSWVRLVPGENVIRLVSAYDTAEARLRVSVHDTWR